MPRNILVLTIGFLCLFCGFDGGQHYLVPSLTVQGRETAALVTFALIYGFFFVGSFFAPRVIDRIGSRMSLVVGALFYPLLLLAVAFGGDTALHIAAVGTGLGASLLWNSVGRIINSSSQSGSIGKHSGTVYSALYVGGILGAAVGGAVLSTLASKSLYLMLASCSALGVLAFAFIREGDDVSVARGDSEKQATASNGVLGGIFVREFLLLAIPIMSANFTLALSFSAVKLFIQQHADLAVIGMAGTTLRFAGGVGAMFSGRLGDRYSAERVLSVLFVCGSLGPLLILFGGASTTVVLGCTCLGLFFGATYPLITAIFRTRVADEAYNRSVQAFLVYRTFGLLVGFLCPIWLSAATCLWIATAVSGIGLVSLLRFARKA